MTIRSLYRDGGEKNQFEMEVLGETIDNGQECYIVLLLPQYQKHFKDGDKTFHLRKCMVDGRELYRLVNERRYEQLRLF